MASTVVIIFDLINCVREARLTLDATAEETLRLCERVEAFEMPVKRLQSEDPKHLAKVSPTLKALEEALIDSYTFVVKYKSQVTIWNRFVKIAFRKTYYDDLKNLNNRLQSAAADLQFTLIVDHEVRRREDMESFNKNMAMCIEQTLLNQGKVDHPTGSTTTTTTTTRDHPHILGEANTFLLEIKSQLAGNSNILNDFLIDMGHRKLSEEEAALQMKRQNELLDRAKLQLDEILGAIDKVNITQQYIIDILQESIAATAAAQKVSNDDRNGRVSRLKSLTISSSDIVNVGRIERGGQGEVILATYQSNSVALKIFKSYDGIGVQDQELSRKQMRVAENELLLLDYLKGPSVVICYGYIPDVKVHTLVLEMAPFGSLWNLLNDYTNFPKESLCDAFPLSLNIAWMADILTALKFLHSKGVRHKDIKAENLLVFDHLKLKVCDFGLSKSNVMVKSFSPVKSGSGAGDSSNASNVGVGTGPFIAPEIRLYGHSETSSDLFSFGITAVQILTRKTPGIKDWDKQIVGALASAFESHDLFLKINGISSLNLSSAKGLSDLSALLSMCVAENPTTRPTSESALTSISNVLAAMGGDPRELFKTDLFSERCREIEDIARELEINRMQLMSPNYRPSGDMLPRGGRQAVVVGGVDVDTTYRDDAAKPKSRFDSMRMEQSSGSTDSGSGGGIDPSRRLLSSLTITEVCYMMHHNNFQCIDNIKQQSINGSMLCYVASEKDLVDLGLQMASVHLRRLFDLIIEYKERGVDSNIFKSAELIPTSYLSRLEPSAADIKAIEELNQTNAALASAKYFLQQNELKIELLQRELKEEREMKSKILLQQSEEKAALLKKEQEVERERQALKLQAKRREIMKAAPIESIFLTPSTASSAGGNSNGASSGSEAEAENIFKDLSTNNQFLIEDALIKIGNLCASDVKAQTTYGTFEYCSKISIAMNVFMSQPSMVSKACFTITKLDNEANREVIGKTGICGAISEALSRHMSDVEVVMQAISAISWLANHPSNKTIFQSCGTREVLKRAVTIHNKNTSIVELANLSITKLDS